VDSEHDRHNFACFVDSIGNGVDIKGVGE